MQALAASPLASLKQSTAILFVQAVIIVLLIILVVIGFALQNTKYHRAGWWMMTGAGLGFGAVVYWHVQTRRGIAKTTGLSYVGQGEDIVDGEYEGADEGDEDVVDESDEEIIEDLEKKEEEVEAEISEESSASAKLLEIFDILAQKGDDKLEPLHQRVRDLFEKNAQDEEIALLLDDAVKDIDSIKESYDRLDDSAKTQIQNMLNELDYTFPASKGKFSLLAEKLAERLNAPRAR